MDANIEPNYHHSSRLESISNTLDIILWMIVKILATLGFVMVVICLIKGILQLQVNN